MAGRRKEPVDLIIAKGKSHHITKDEYDKRKAEEGRLNVPQLNGIPPVPESIKGNAKLEKEFIKYATLLSKLGTKEHRLFSELDVDCLERYIVSHALYVRYTSKLLKATDMFEIKTLQSIQNKAFAQAHQSASVLGLNITSRCKLVVPETENDNEDEF